MLEAPEIQLRLSSYRVEEEKESVRGAKHAIRFVRCKVTSRVLCCFAAKCVPAMLAPGAVKKAHFTDCLAKRSRWRQSIPVETVYVPHLADREQNRGRHSKACEGTRGDTGLQRGKSLDLHGHTDSNLICLVNLIYSGILYL